MLTRQQCRRKHRRVPRRRTGPNSWERYQDGLKLMGFRSYAEYLASDVWKAFHEFWKTSGCPCYCAVCGKEEYQLHHWTYSRVCNEDLNDVIPLCAEHHQLLHAFVGMTDTKLSHLYSQFKTLFGWGETEVRARLWWVFRTRSPKPKIPKPLKNAPRKQVESRNRRIEARRKKVAKVEEGLKKHYRRRAARFEKFDRPVQSPVVQAVESRNAGEAASRSPCPEVQSVAKARP